jgi:hypothetical protein
MLWSLALASDLNVTDGKLSLEHDGTYRVDSSEMRASGSVPGSTATLIVLSPEITTVVSRLGSGQYVNQIGLKVNERNVCNLVYVMRVFSPRPAIVISKKSNPGKSEFQECRDRGYTLINRIDLAPGFESFTMQVRVQDDLMTVEYGRWLTKTVSIPREPGTFGVRSDNVSASFRIFVR